MTRLFLLAGALIFAFHSIAQGDFTVIKVIGEISYLSSNVSMKSGDVFNPKEKLVFKSADSKAAVINPQKGRFLITAPGSNKLSGQALFVPSMGNVSSKSLGDELTGKYMVIDSARIDLFPAFFILNDSSFFFFKYDYKEEEINKKLVNGKANFTINRESFFSVDSIQVDEKEVTNIRLFYFFGNSAELQSQFSVVFPDLATLKDEVSVIIKTFEGCEAQLVFGYIVDYLESLYGKTDRNDVKKWLEKEFGMIGK